MNETKIEKNIPIPIARGEAARDSVFNKMSVGDSIFFNGSMASVNGKVSNFRASKYGLEKTFTRRSIGKGVRVWRIK